MAALWAIPSWSRDRVKPPGLSGTNQSQEIVSKFPDAHVLESSTCNDDTTTKSVSRFQNHISPSRVEKLENRQPNSSSSSSSTASDAVRPLPRELSSRCRRSTRVAYRAIAHRLGPGQAPGSLHDAVHRTFLQFCIHRLITLEAAPRPSQDIRLSGGLFYS